VQIMGQLLKTRHYAGEVMGILAAEEKEGILMVEKVGRNQPCPCGSGKKYKQFHGTRHKITKCEQEWFVV